MKIVTLFVDMALRARVEAALGREGFAPLPIAAADRLAEAFGMQGVLGAVVEAALPDLCGHLMAPPEPTKAVPIVAVGPADEALMQSVLAGGAADYVFDDDIERDLLRRLCARIEASRSRRPDSLAARGFRLCGRASTLAVAGRTTKLTAREFALAWILFSDPERIVTSDTLSTRVWGRPADLCRRTLEQHIYRLRGKLQSLLPGAARIATVYRVGYRLELRDPSHARRADAPGDRRRAPRPAAPAPLSDDMAHVMRLGRRIVIG